MYHPSLPSKGSIVVDYDVILKAQYTPGFENTLDNIVSDLEVKIKNATTVQVQDTNNSCSGKVFLEGHTFREQPINVSTSERQMRCHERRQGSDESYVVSYIDPGKPHDLSQRFHNLPKQQQHLETKCPNAQACREQLTALSWSFPLPVQSGGAKGASVIKGFMCLIHSFTVFQLNCHPGAKQCHSQCQS